MNRIKRWKNRMSLLLTVLLAAGMLAGCSGKDESGTQEHSGTDSKGGAQQEGSDFASEGQEGGTGRFVETERFLPEGVDLLMATERNTDGSINGFGCDGQYLSFYLLNTADQGESWSKTKVENLNAIFLSRVASAPDGGAAAFGYYSNDGAVGLKVIAKDGSVREVPLTLPAYEGGGDSKNQITQAKYTEAGQLLAVDLNGNLYRVDIDTGEMTQVNTSLAGMVGYVDTVENKILAVTGEGVLQLDATNGEALPDQELLKGTTSEKEMLGTDGNYFPVVYDHGATAGSVVYVNHQGLFYLEETAAVSEQLINGEQVSLGDSSTMFSAVYTLDQENYLVFGADSLGVNRCYSYRYDAGASAVPTQQISVYALEDSSVLQQIISYYKKENPDVFVKKTIGMAEGSGMTAEDALRALNTEILAGNGPDLLILDGMPVESYQEKGVLADIGNYVEAAASQEGLFENITDSFRMEDGKLCQVPLRFFFSVAEGEQEALAAAKNLESLAAYGLSLREENPEKQILSNTTAKNLLEKLYYADSAGWKGKDGGIDRETLLRFLSAAEKLYGLDRHEDATESMGKALIGGNLYGTATFSANSRLANGTLLSFGSVARAENMQDIYGMQRQIGGSLSLLNTDIGNSFVPYISLGLTVKGAENPSAQRFLETALGSSCQSVVSDGFSVNRKAYQDNFGRMKEYSVAMSGPDDQVVGYEMQLLSEDQQQALTDMIESLTVPAMTDRVILELVLTEGENCLKGHQSAEQSADAILQKIRLYLAE